MKLVLPDPGHVTCSCAITLSPSLGADPLCCIDLYKSRKKRKQSNNHSLHQQNVNRSRSNTQSSQTLWLTLPVLLSTSKCSQTTLELSKVLSDSARAFSGAPESTCSYGGAFRMIRDLTYVLVQSRRMSLRGETGPVTESHPQ